MTSLFLNKNKPPLLNRSKIPLTPILELLLKQLDVKHLLLLLQGNFLTAQIIYEINHIRPAGDK